MTCIHHWMISPPSPGADLLAGTCRHCGATRCDFVAFESVEGYYMRLRTPKLKGSAPPKAERVTQHGRWRYLNQGCRCPICCEASRAYNREYMARKRKMAAR